MGEGNGHFFASGLASVFVSDLISCQRIRDRRGNSFIELGSVSPSRRPGTRISACIYHDYHRTKDLIVFRYVTTPNIRHATAASHVNVENNAYATYASGSPVISAHYLSML
jgi:hypothetical protein